MKKLYQDQIYDYEEQKRKSLSEECYMWISTKSVSHNNHLVCINSNSVTKEQNITKITNI